MHVAQNDGRTIFEVVEQFQMRIVQNPEWCLAPAVMPLPLLLLECSFLESWKIRHARLFLPGDRVGTPETPRRYGDESTPMRIKMLAL